MSDISLRPLVVGMPFLDEAGRYALVPQHDVVESSDPAEIEKHAIDADALYAYRPFCVSAEMIARCPRLKIIAAGGSGYDHIDVDAARSAGVVVTRAGGFGALSVAEHVIGLMIAVSKRLVENDAFVRSGRPFVEKRHGHLYAEISGATLVIVGFGAIGRELARIGKHGFGMKVIAVTHQGRPACSPDVECTMALHDALAVADIVSVNTPLTPQTKGLIGRPEFKAMKPGALLIDTSRGGVVDADALADALVSGKIRGAGVDVLDTEPPLLDHPLLNLYNTVLSPHSAGFTAAASRRLALFIAEDIARALRGERPLGMVGPPHAWLESRAAQMYAN